MKFASTHVKYSILYLYVYMACHIIYICGCAHVAPNWMVGIQKLAQSVDCGTQMLSDSPVLIMIYEP